MNSKAWSPEEREEYDTICAEAWETSGRQVERTDEFLRLLCDARQAQRFYAADVLDEAERRGVESLLKGWHKARNRIAVAFDGKIISKPRVIGTTRIDDEGCAYSVQTLFDYMDFEEIEAKVVEYLKQISAYKANVHIAMRLLELRDLAPGTSTPAEAAEYLGISIEDFLTAEAGAA